MTHSPHKLIPADYDPAPSLQWLEKMQFAVQDAAAAAASGSPAAPGTYTGYVLTIGQSSAPAVGVELEQLKELGFTAQVGTGQILAHPGGARCVIGLGEATAITAATLRDAAACLVRTARQPAALHLLLEDTYGLGEYRLGQMLAEGITLAAYRYTGLQTMQAPVALESVTVFSATLDATALTNGWRAGLVSARATCLTRDLANNPPGHLTATALGELAEQLGEKFGFQVEVFGKPELIQLGCGGILGVNAGSVEEPRLIKLTYQPAPAATGHLAPGQQPKHLALVGKGIMYDSGGLSLKPSDPMHLLMKMDMAGAGAILGTFSALSDLQVATKVTGFLACTDNLPSGSATKLGDVLRARNGKTVEVRNTDAEGRLVLMDGLSLAVEESPDAVVDIATLTGAALMALGDATAALFSNNQKLAALLALAGREVAEPLWQLPLEPKYRKQLDSQVADLSNMGGKFAGATTAALFLQEVVDKVPWAHLDIAGTMNSVQDELWQARGATGFGARLLLEVSQQLGKVVPS